MKILIVILIGLLGVFTNGEVMACSCIGQESVKNEIKRNKAVFVGKVVSKEKLTITHKLLGTENSINREFYKVTLEVITTYKGKIKANQIEIITGVGNGDCGFGFELDRSYVVYAELRNKYFTEGDKIDKFWYTDICKRTTSDIEKEKTEIEKYRKPCEK